jgi:hypothetical protein
MEPIAHNNQAAESDRLRVVVDDAGSACWEICSGGVCLRDRDGARVMSRYRDLRRSQGRVIPIN